MTPIEETRRMLGHLNLPESELIKIRDMVDIMADIIVRGFWDKIAYERNANTKRDASDSIAVSSTGLVNNPLESGEETTHKVD
jgi:hypothetical protein